MVYLEGGLSAMPLPPVCLDTISKTKKYWYNLCPHSVFLNMRSKRHVSEQAFPTYQCVSFLNHTAHPLIRRI